MLRFALPSRRVVELKVTNALLRAVAEGLRPFVRQLITAGVPSSRVESLVRAVYVDVAAEEFAIEGLPQTDSRIAVLTGVHRKDVRRFRTRSDDDSPRSLRRDLSATLVARWMQDRRATDSAGKPIPIPFRAKRGVSFVALARATSRDLRPKSILDELVRAGAVVRLERNMVALRGAAYVPASGVAEKLAMLAEDPAELIETMRRNVFAPESERFLQRKVSFDNVGSEALPEVRRKLQRIGERTIVQVNRLLAAYDRDLNPRAPGGERSYATLGVYYFESPTDDPKRPRAKRPLRKSRSRRERKARRG